jgi:hypothetical protein
MGGERSWLSFGTAEILLTCRLPSAHFDPIWSHLEPAEQARVIQILIERIDYDGGTSNLAIVFRSSRVWTLAEEAQAAVDTNP